MRDLLSAAGRSFLRAALAVFITYSLGIFDAPTLHQKAALAAAMSIAAVAAGLRAVQAYAPQLTLTKALHLGVTLGAVVDAFVRAFAAVLISGLVAVLAAPDLGAARALAVAAIVGALASGLRAAEGLLTLGSGPAARVGVPQPKNP